MTFQEKIFFKLLENVYTISLGQITFVDETRSIANVKTLNNLIIPSVPIFQLGNDTVNIKIKMSVGDTVPVFHTKLDSSKFFDTGQFEENEIKDNFSCTNAFILPFVANFFEKSFEMPTFDIELKGDVKITGSLEITENLKVTKNIEAGIEVKAGPTKVRLSQHSHNVQVAPTTGTGSTVPPIIP